MTNSTEHKERTAARNRAFWPVAIALIALLACGAIFWHIWSQNRASLAASEQEIAKIREMEAARDAIKALLALPPCEAAEKTAKSGLARSFLKE